MTLAKDTTAITKTVEIIAKIAGCIIQRFEPAEYDAIATAIQRSLSEE